MAALGHLKERGIRVHLKAVVTKLIEDELREMKELADAFGYPISFAPVITPRDDGEEYPMELVASEEGLRALYSAGALDIGNQPIERKEGEMLCNVATGTLHVDPYGNVLPCTQWPEAGGNIREQRIEEIWRDSPVFRSAREIALKLPGMVHEQTPDHEFCHPCPALSKLCYDDPLRIDEQQLRIAKVRRQVAKEDSRSGTGKPPGTSCPI
jgi:radical SAM protein with 4Fe4S-binding SPASM domain